ncbi:AAA-like domain-containing protein [Laspinema olomoucense]|uniref:AAA-like domain-containing protein n=1 Tax=Laspinema olomoucense TaxID=3231600 RepID=UPI0021BB6583|nr:MULTISPECIES: AAA-like domain-containing protein [unclassified Laspinema]MCT7976075.1 AAA-like domain-containing protein [Laspinema sp. D3d]MCT7987545.1 AAA-like domain-containing protein [Laspinema sp. D3a]
MKSPIIAAIAHNWGKSLHLLALISRNVEMNNIESIILLVDVLVKEKTGQSLSDTQRIVLAGSLQHKTYRILASEHNYSSDYVSQNVAPKLWNLLADVLGEPITKSNCLAILAGRMAKAYRVNQPLIDTIKRKVGASEFSSMTGVHQQNGIELLTESQNSLETLIQKRLETLSLRSPPSHASEPLNAIPKLISAPNLEYSESKVSLSSPFYILRRSDLCCHQELAKSGVYLQISGAKKMGKTSLLERIIAHATENNDRAVRLNLQQAGSSAFTCGDKFFRWFCTSITRQLKLESKLNEYWDENMGSLESCTDYFQEYLLPQIDTALVLALDECDLILAYPELAGDFFRLLRYWYEESQDSTLWQKLRLVMVKSRQCNVEIAGTFDSFNIGMPIELLSFTAEQVDELAARHGLEFSSRQKEELMQLLGGHPYLVRLAFYLLASQEISLAVLIETAATETGIYREHLHQQLRAIQKHSQVKGAFRQVLREEFPLKGRRLELLKLQEMGLVKIENHRMKVSCGVYGQYFGEALL